METNYEMNERVDIISWSQCGDHTAILNVNSEVRIAPPTSRDKGLMTVGCPPFPWFVRDRNHALLIGARGQVDSFDGRLHVQFMANWRSC